VICHEVFQRQQRVYATKSSSCSISNIVDDVLGAAGITNHTGQTLRTLTRAKGFGCVCVCVCLRVCVCERERERERARARPCIRASVRPCVRASVRPCVRASVCAHTHVRVECTCWHKLSGSAVRWATHRDWKMLKTQVSLSECARAERCPRSPIRRGRERARARSLSPSSPPSPPPPPPPRSLSLTSRPAPLSSKQQADTKHAHYT
jgi:hypothetical protein